MASTQNTGHPAFPPIRADHDLSSELRRMTLEWPIVLNSRDANFQTPRGQMIASTIAPDFRATLDGYPGKMTWTELLQVWGQEHVDYPDCRLEVTDCSVYVDEKVGAAKVYIELDMKFVERIDLKALTELRWVRWDDGRWMVRGFYLMRGHKGSTGFV